MKKTVLALTTVLMLAGAMASTASAQQIYYSYDVTYANDLDRDGVPNRYDRYDNRYDRYGNTLIRDRDCDGVPNRFDTNDRRSARDIDCDGIPNRFDRYNNRMSMASTRYYAPRYIEPYGYRYGRWDVGSRLPIGYYGSAYYIDYRPYGLPPPPVGYQWNRVGNDVYLVSTRDGLIAQVIYSLFR